MTHHAYLPEGHHLMKRILAVLATAGLAFGLTIAAAPAASATDTTKVVTWYATDYVDGYGPGQSTPTDADHVTWPQALYREQDCGGVEQIDTYKYGTEQERAKVEALIAGGTLNRPGTTEPLDGDVYLSHVFEVLPACAPPSSTTEPTTSEPTTTIPTTSESPTTEPTTSEPSTSESPTIVTETVPTEVTVTVPTETTVTETVPTETTVIVPTTQTEVTSTSATETAPGTTATVTSTEPGITTTRRATAPRVTDAPVTVTAKVTATATVRPRQLVPAAARTTSSEVAAPPITSPSQQVQFKPVGGVSTGGGSTSRHDLNTGAIIGWTGAALLLAAGVTFLIARRRQGASS